MSTSNEFSVIELLKNINESSRYEEICKMTPEQKNEYDKLLDKFNNTNNNSSCSTKEKGDSLEKLTFYLLSVTGQLFKVHKNLRTTTNEIDVVMTLTPAGRVLKANGLINTLYDNFIGECKNYANKVSVTYVGKFCSLLLSNQIKLGVLFSYNGVTGSNWDAGSGLIKKFYLHKEKIEDRFCIIDFNINDFMAIKNGDNFLQIIDSKLLSLQLDTDYAGHISQHPAEKQ